MRNIVLPLNKLRNDYFAKIASFLFLFCLLFALKDLRAGRESFSLVFDLLSW